MSLFPPLSLHWCLLVQSSRQISVMLHHCLYSSHLTIFPGDWWILSGIAIGANVSCTKFAAICQRGAARVLALIELNLATTLSHHPNDLTRRWFLGFYWDLWGGCHQTQTHAHLHGWQIVKDAVPEHHLYLSIGPERTCLSVRARSMCCAHHHQTQSMYLRGSSGIRTHSFTISV